MFYTQETKCYKTFVREIYIYIYIYIYLLKYIYIYIYIYCPHQQQYSYLSIPHFLSRFQILFLIGIFCSLASSETFVFLFNCINIKTYIQNLIQYISLSNSLIITTKQGAKYKLRDIKVLFYIQYKVNLKYV
jgi:hypothetical protein